LTISSITLTEHVRFVFRNSTGSPKGADMNTKSYAAIAALTASALAGALVYASQYGERANTARSEDGQAPISLTQAIAVAERHVPGNAVGAELEQRDGRGIYEVEVASAGRTVEVKVDSADGSVIGPESERAAQNAREGKKDRG
jgi:uncharacterized membrane protein YkoI